MRTLLLVAFLLAAWPAVAQVVDEPIEPGPIGLAVALQGNQFDILMPVRMSPQTSVVPALGFSYVQDLGVDLRTGVALRQYLRDGRMRPYLGARAGVMFLFPVDRTFGPSPDTTTDFLIGGLAGGEVFLMRFLSVGVEAQLNAAFSGEGSTRFGNPGGAVINTGASAFVTVYF